MKKLVSLGDRVKQRAEVSAHFQRYDESEALYRELDRKDLAIELRQRLGDWFRVVHLVKQGYGGDDTQLQTAWDRIGKQCSALRMSHMDISRASTAMRYLMRISVLVCQARLW